MLSCLFLTFLLRTPTFSISNWATCYIMSILFESSLFFHLIVFFSVDQDIWYCMLQLRPLGMKKYNNLYVHGDFQSAVIVWPLKVPRVDCEETVPPISKRLSTFMVIVAGGTTVRFSPCSVSILYNPFKWICLPIKLCTLLCISTSSHFTGPLPHTLFYKQ